MDKEIISQLNRAKELKKELEESVKKDLYSHAISEKTLNLTQEVLVKIRSILDQAMYSFFKKEIAKSMTEDEEAKARVYFPLVQTREDLKSCLGRAKMADLEKTKPQVFSFLESIQPYHSQYSWLKELSKYANEKHIRLSPQRRIESKCTTVTNQGGGQVSWGPGVTFGRGVSIMGAQINPITQNIVPTLGVESKTEIWVSFMFENSNVNSVWLCNTAIENSEKILNDFYNLFDKS